MVNPVKTQQFDFNNLSLYSNNLRTATVLSNSLLRQGLYLFSSLRYSKNLKECLHMYILNDCLLNEQKFVHWDFLSYSKVTISINKKMRN